MKPIHFEVGDIRFYATGDEAYAEVYLGGDITAVAEGKFSAAELLEVAIEALTVMKCLLSYPQRKPNEQN